MWLYILFTSGFHCRKLNIQVNIFLSRSVHSKKVIIILSLMLQNPKCILNQLFFLLKQALPRGQYPLYCKKMKLQREMELHIWATGKGQWYKYMIPFPIDISLDPTSSGERFPFSWTKDSNLAKSYSFTMPILKVAQDFYINFFLPFASRAKWPSKEPSNSFISILSSTTTTSEYKSSATILHTIPTVDSEWLWTWMMGWSRSTISLPSWMCSPTQYSTPKIITIVVCFYSLAQLKIILIYSFDNSISTSTLTQQQVMPKWFTINSKMKMSSMEAIYKQNLARRWCLSTKR